MSRETSSSTGRRIPTPVWALTLVGAVVGALLAAPGDFVGNTIPSTLFFGVAGLLVGLVANLMAGGLRRR